MALNMRNLVLNNRSALEKYHYIRKADPNRNYWFDFSCPKLKNYIKMFGEDFCIILAGDENLEGDFYSIPFNVVIDLFTDEYLSNDKNGKNRWVGIIRDHELKINNCSQKTDISIFYGNPLYLSNKTDLFNLLSTSNSISENEIQDDPNEYAIQNRKIEINSRQKQSLFRKRVLDNFNWKCCLTEISESNFLRASHIVPWSHSISSRLDPSNGLCLSVTYDHLFDQGYISFDESLKVIITPEFTSFSFSFQKILSGINRVQASIPKMHLIKQDYLSYHRQNILIR